MARGQDQLRWETPALSCSFSWNVKNTSILSICGNDGGNVGMTEERWLQPFFPGLQELSRQSKGQIKIHQPGKTAGIPLISESHSPSAQSHPSSWHRCIPLGRIPHTQIPEATQGSPAVGPLHGSQSSPNPPHILPGLASPLLSPHCSSQPRMCRGFLWLRPSRQDEGKEIFPWPRGSPTSPIRKGSGSFFSSDRAFAGKGLVSQGLEPNPWGPWRRGLERG